MRSAQVARTARSFQAFPKPFCSSVSLSKTASPHNETTRINVPRGSEPSPPITEEENLSTGKEAPTFLGTTKRLPEFNLAGKVVVVTGAARGLGLTQAEALLEAGAIVYAVDILPEPSPDYDRVKERAKTELGTSLHYRQIDVRDVDALNKTIESIGTTHGRMDGLVAAAGIQQETPALDYKASDANRLLEVNVTGVFMAAQAVAKQMIKYGNGGSIVMIASMSGTVANRGLISPIYNASKGAVLQLGRSLASEWGQHGIRVNTISPGYIVTSMVEDLFIEYPERRAQWASHNMLGRLSQPREYRGAICFLVSEASSFMTGSDLRIDGGHVAW
ncbi:MAG: hypothetical protein M1825_005251 [Sarcosagium campestre]|nr:MAG: hypothetical protein M1825_005251 [Sarcosagium campestre]